MWGEKLLQVLVCKEGTKTIQLPDMLKLLKLQAQNAQTIKRAHNKKKTISNE
jgi:hypothetical protein